MRNAIAVKVVGYILRLNDAILFSVRSFDGFDVKRCEAKNKFKAPFRESGFIIISNHSGIQTSKRILHEVGNVLRQIDVIKAHLHGKK